jgi:hypothetical protein
MSFWTACGLPEPTPEYNFHPTRRWRFDFAWIPQKVAVEIEGGIWMKGRGAHSRPSNVLRDMEKQNEAGKLGWRIFRFTPTEYNKGIVQAFLKDVL